MMMYTILEDVVLNLLFVRRCPYPGIIFPGFKIPLWIQRRLKKMIRLEGTPQAERYGWWSERRGDVRPPACSVPLLQWFFRKALAATIS